MIALERVDPGMSKQLWSDSPHDARERAFEGTSFKISRATGLRPGRKLVKKRAYACEIPTVFAEISSSSDGSLSDDSELWLNPEREYGIAGAPVVLRDKITATDTTTPPEMQMDEFGLPPTPPTMADPDLAEPRAESLPLNSQFADAVRNALQSERSLHGLRTSGPFGSPHTPDPSPPTTSPVENKSLQLPQLPAHTLRPYASSRADSFHTARETANSTPFHPAYSPSPDSSQFSLTLNGHGRPWVNESQRPGGLIEDESRTALGSLTQRPVQRSPVQGYAADIDSSPASRNHQLGNSGSSGSASPHYSNGTETLLSYTTTSPSMRGINGQSESLGRHDGRINQYTNSADSRLSGLGLSMPTSDDDKDVSAEDVNNLIYKHIQQANVRRHNEVEKRDAMPVSIIAVRDDKQRTLKRTVKCRALRENAGEESPSSSIGGDLTRSQYPKHNPKVRPLVDDPSQQLHMSQDSSPATAVTALTHYALVTIRGDEPDSPSGRQIERQHTLRRSQKVDHFERTSFSQSSVASPKVSQSSPSLAGSPRTLRHFSRETKLENNRYVRRTSLEQTSPWAKNFDMRTSHPSATPMSQHSDRTEVEVLEARGVSIYPHNNDSVLVIEAGSHPSSRDASSHTSGDMLSKVTPAVQISSLPSYDTHLNSTRRTPDILIDDTQLTNPRPAPEPPAFIVIPPTPTDELERMSGGIVDVAGKPQRQQSLLQRARRYSESIVQPFFSRTSSFRSQKQPSRPSTAEREEAAANQLSPLWRPRYFWENVDDSSSDTDPEQRFEDEELQLHQQQQYQYRYQYQDDDYEQFVIDSLPGSGDTYNFDASSVESLQHSITTSLPRKMSVRMPGFRGDGGFLVGNTLGLDRHGTNVRRHYISAPAPPPASSATRGRIHSGQKEVLRRYGYAHKAVPPHRSASLPAKSPYGQWKTNANESSGRVFSLPFSGTGRKVQYVGFTRWTRSLAESRQTRRDRAREKRCQALRSQIKHTC